MPGRSALIFIILSLFTVSANAELIRVRLAKNLDQYQLRSAGLTLSLCNAKAECINKKYLGEFELSSLASGLQVKMLPGVYKRVYVHSSSLLNSEGERLPKHLSFVHKSNGLFDLVGSLDLESYLGGVLPQEMPVSWPIESLKAQAIASRSYVLSQKRNNKSLHFDVETDVMDQVFKLKRLPSKWQKKVELALTSTRSEILSRGVFVVKAYFHSHCGGHTEMATNVWPGSLGFESVKDPFCKGGAPLKWKSLKNFQQIETAYKKNTKDDQVRGLMAVRKGDSNPSGRVDSLFLFFKDNKIRRWSATEFRKTLGFSDVKSTRFLIQQRNNSVQITGSGYGHGVGLCQHGAKVMAKAGKSYRQILEHYYPQTTIAKLSELKDEFQARK